MRLEHVRHLSGPNVFTTAPVSIARTGTRRADLPGEHRVPGVRRAPGDGAAWPARASLRGGQARRVYRCAGQWHVFRACHRARGARAVRAGRARRASGPDDVGRRGRPVRRDDGVPGGRARGLRRAGRAVRAGDHGGARSSRETTTGYGCSSGGDRQERGTRAPRPEHRGDRGGGARARHPGPPGGRPVDPPARLRLPPAAGQRRHDRADLGHRRGHRLRQDARQAVPGQGRHPGARGHGRAQTRPSRSGRSARSARPS